MDTCGKAIGEKLKNQFLTQNSPSTDQTGSSQHADAEKAMAQTDMTSKHESRSSVPSTVCRKLSAMQGMVARAFDPEIQEAEAVGSV